MKLGIVVPWLCVAGSLCGLALVYSGSQKKDAELATLRADSEQLQKVRAELDDLKTNQNQNASDELTRLRRDHDELLRLRNRVQELQRQVQQTQGQLQAAQNQAQSAQAQAQAQAQALSAKAVPQPAPGAPGAPPGVTPEQANTAACINNLRMIEAAKQQWAQQNGKPAGALMTPADIAVFFPNSTVPACPAGGVYTINPAGIAPLCTAQGHTLSK